MVIKGQNVRCKAHCLIKYNYNHIVIIGKLLVILHKSTRKKGYSLIIKF